MSRRPQRGTAADDRGSVSVFALVAAVILVLFVGVVVDLGGVVHTMQQAQDVARQAARTAAQAASASTVSGGSVGIDSARAVQAGQAYLATADVPGTVTIAGDQVMVQTTLTYTPVILSLAGIGTKTVTGSSTAQLQRSLQGVQQ